MKETEDKQIQSFPLMIQKSRSFKMFISEYTELKIRKACQLIPNIEWSGVLFYRAEGTFENESLEIHVVDFFPMDIGTATYTEFMISPDVPAYMIDHPELMEAGVHRGLVHSHNTMSTFFSITDTNTLKEFGMEMPHFVSLIVNNQGEYSAAITRRIPSQNVVTQFQYPSFGGKVVKAKETETNGNDIIEYFKFDITIEGRDKFEDFIGRFKELEREKEKKKEVAHHYNINDDWRENLKARYDKTYPSFSEPKSTFNQEEREENYGVVDVNAEIESIKDKGTVTPMSEEDLIDYKNIKVDPSIIDTLVRQLLTASVVIPGSSKLDLRKWTYSMNNLFEARFGNEDIFQQFAANYVDFLVSTTIDEEAFAKVKGDDSALMAVIAYWLIEALNKLPSNKWIEHYITLLNDYII